ncbi:MAG: VgrG-related protein [Dehalococcoidia bacterium]|nr:VgrG-related protein [Dehalococcoidia bacterium]
MTTPTLHSAFQVKLNGADVSSDMMGDLRSMETDATMYHPSMITLEFHDPALKWVDDATVKIGAAVELLAKRDSATATSLLKGEVTAIEPFYRPDGALSLRITAFDRGHRLHNGRKTKTYLQVTDSDIVSAVAGAAGLSASSDTTSEVYKYVLQDNLTDYEFLRQRARLIGFYLRVEGTSLQFKKWSSLTTGSPAATLNWGTELFEFRPRLTAASQAAEVSVRGWDPATKQAIVGRASSAELLHSLGINGNNASSAGGITPGNVVLVDVPVPSQSAAQAVAQSMLNEMRNGDIFAEGECYGNAAIAVGKVVKIDKVGTRFAGNYLLTRVQHQYDYERGWITRFEATNGASSSTGDLLLDAAGSPRHDTSFGRGLVIGLVTNVKDPDGDGRVKVKFPWLADNVESNWCRFATPMTGNARGFQFMPEINDEVVVGFEHGDVNRPFILGCLWNGRDKPPLATSAFEQGGQVIVRQVKTRAGHLLTFTDKSGGEKIEIIDKTGNQKITWDSVKNEIDIDAQAKVQVKAAEILVEATTKATVKSAQIELNASGMMKLQAGGPVEIKGAVIKLN